jgi:thiaminase
MVKHIHHEMALHVDYCKGFGITKAEMEASEESQGVYSCRIRSRLIKEH